MIFSPSESMLSLPPVKYAVFYFFFTIMKQNDAILLETWQIQPLLQ